MSTVVVIEPYALLRFGILQHLAEALPAARIEGVDYATFSDEPPICINSDLVLLSAAFHENVHELIDATQRVFTPKYILLLSDTDTMPRTWANLPPLVAGYVSKTATPDMLMASIRLVLLGGRCFQTSHQAGEDNDHAPPRSPRAEPLPGDLEISPTMMTIEAETLHITPRQYEVLVLLARGYPIKTISRHLGISIATAKAHAETLYQRLHAHNRNEAVYAAIARGATLGWQRLGAASNAMSARFAAPATRDH